MILKEGDKLETISKRIARCIEESGLTKTAFASRINLSQRFVSQLTSGASAPSDRTIADICREFNISEEWLRTGEGPMRIELTRSQQIASFVGDVLSSSKPDFRSTLISVLSQLDEKEWEAIESITLKFVDAMQKEKADP